MPEEEGQEIIFTENTAPDREIWDEKGGLIKKGAAAIAERDQDHVPEVKVLTTLGTFAVPVTAETTIGEIRQKVQEWKPEYSLEQIELVCKDKDAWGPLFNKTSRPHDDEEWVEVVADTFGPSYFWNVRRNIGVTSLPTGRQARWRAAWPDPDGRPYFIHVASGATTWELPGVPVDPHDEGEWVEVVSNTGGPSYFWNIRSNCTVAHLPTHQLAPWRAYTSPDGHPYFFHVASGVSTWELPGTPRDC